MAADQMREVSVEISDSDAARADADVSRIRINGSSRTHCNAEQASEAIRARSRAW